MIRILIPALLALSASAAWAGPVAIQVNGADGRPLPGAVVTVDLPGAVAPVPSTPFEIEQRNIQFDPHVTIVPVGATVNFPNRDRVRHHVYSFSRPKRIDLRLYGRDETRSVLFDRAGVVALGCNIHDAMSAFVYVTATPFAAQTDTGGRIRFADVPAGNAVLRIWHPSIRAPGNSVQQALTLAGSGFSTVVTLRR